jgi:hypothetical protein
LFLNVLTNNFVGDITGTRYEIVHTQHYKTEIA